MGKRTVKLTRYEGIASGTIYFGYDIKDATTKDIDGVKYIEVADSLVCPKIFFVRYDTIKETGVVEVEV